MNEELQVATIPDRSVQLGALRAESPTNVVDVATLVANKLNHVIESKKLFANVQGKKFPTCEAWTTCAAMLGVSAKERDVRQTEEGDYEASVDLIDGSGAVVGGASAICGADEPTWANRPRYARRSMAVTRATSKACRLKFSWIMTLAGYQPCPAEEVPDNGFIEDRQDRREREANGNGHSREIKPLSAFANARKVMQQPVKEAVVVDPDAPDWRNVICAFGKKDGPLRGKPLGELSDRNLDYLTERFVDSGEPIAEKDEDMVNALMIRRQQLKGTKNVTAPMAPITPVPAPAGVVSEEQDNLDW